MALRHHGIVVGLGNPILGDDGVGWIVTDAVERLLGSTPTGTDVDRAAVGGLGLMERLVGYDHAVIVDAIRTGRAPVGTVRQLPLEALANPDAGHAASAHDVSLAAALAAGRALGADLPTHVTLVAVEIPPVDELSDHLTPAVAAAVPVAATLALQAVLHDSH